MKGKLIVIEGTDGTGKGTQQKLLIKKLIANGYSTGIADFPRYGEKSASLVEYYLNGEFGKLRDVTPYQGSVFYAVDRYAASFGIREDLEAGKIVVCNRYVSANMGHQASKIKDPYELDKFLEWAQDLEYGIFKIPEPDLTILLYVPPKMAQRMVDQKDLRAYIKGKKRDLHEDDLAHLEASSKAYLYCAKKYGWNLIDCAPNGKMLPRSDVLKKIWEVVSPLVS